MYITVSNGIHPNNTYLLYNENNDCIIVDPSYGYNDIDRIIVKNKFNVVGIIITHGHYDHIASVDYFVDKYQVDVYGDKKLDEYFKSASVNLSKYSVNAPEDLIVRATPKVAITNLKIKDFQFEVIKFYGHTMTCNVYFIDDIAFTGDFVFKGTIGNTNLLGSSHEVMQKSLKKFLTLRKDFVILPGHGQSSTFYNEKKYNRFLVELANG